VREVGVYGGMTRAICLSLTAIRELFAADPRLVVNLNVVYVCGLCSMS
jgi:hypothetical protein